MKTIEYLDLSGHKRKKVRTLFHPQQWNILDFPFEQVPVLEVDGIEIPQSIAIARFLARKAGECENNAKTSLSRSCRKN